MDKETSDESFAEQVLQELVQSDNPDHDAIQEMVDHIMNENKEKELEEKHKSLNTTDELIDYSDIADPIMNEDLVQLDLVQAYEDVPEFFIPINMLYVSCTINNQLITAFLDTGAQISVMNITTAVKCNLYDRIDTKRKSTLVGVGQQDSVGTVYNVELIFGACYTPCNFTILRNGPDIILGLNFMKAHKATIDLASNVFKIGTYEMPFINKH